MRLLIIISFLLLSSFAFAQKREDQTLKQKSPWKFFYIRDSSDLAFQNGYYEVFYNGKKVVLPKTLGGTKSIAKFYAATIFKYDQALFSFGMIGIEDVYPRTLLLKPSVDKKYIEAEDICTNELVTIKIN